MLDARWGRNAGLGAEAAKACGGVEAGELGQKAQARGCRLNAEERCD